MTTLPRQQGHSRPTLALSPRPVRWGLFACCLVFFDSVALSAIEQNAETLMPY